MSEELRVDLAEALESVKQAVRETAEECAKIALQYGDESGYAFMIAQEIRETFK